MVLVIFLAHLKKFEYTVDADNNFPMHDGGKVIFGRDWFIKETANLVLAKKYSKFGSYYWRAPFGSGKTVFLKLMGRELQRLGCDVYMTSGGALQQFDEDYFPNLAKQAAGKTVVLLIDEVQADLNSMHWIPLLKGSKPANLLVLGVGIPLIGQHSPQFDHKYPNIDYRFPMFLTINDLPEVYAYF